MIKIHSLNSRLRGQSLIEVLVALGVIAVIVSSLAAVVVLALGNTRFSKDQNLGVQYAQEGLELMRRIRDGDYAGFRNIPNGTYCLNKGANNLSANCFSANADSFLRKVTIQQSGCASNVTSVVVNVYWQDSKCPAANLFCHSSQLSTCLSSVSPVQAF